MARNAVMPLNSALESVRRLPWIASSGQRAAAVEIAALIIAGAAAAGLSFFLGGWKIPGSAIVQAVLPMAAGLALVPRQRAGLLMGTSAVATTFVLASCGFGHATPSTYARLFLFGLCLDFSAARVGTRWHVWLAFIVAGLAANLLGFGFKLLAAQCGWEGWGGRGLLSPWPARLASFAICGAIAGGICGMVFFRRSKQAPPQATATKD